MGSTPLLFSDPWAETPIEIPKDRNWIIFLGKIIALRMYSFYGSYAFVHAFILSYYSGSLPRLFVGVASTVTMVEFKLLKAFVVTVACNMC